jgi:sulfatase modifying factor 1
MTIMTRRQGLIGALIGLVGCTYHPAVPDRFQACQVATDCPQAGDQCVPLPERGPSVSVCCHDCTADAAAGDAAGPDRAAHDAAVADLATDAADARPGPDLAADAPADAPPAPAPCPDGRGGPPLVRSGDVCIDATEVTNAQYAVFWTARAAGRDVEGQIPACAWNLSFTPDTAAAPWPFRPGTERRPVVNVDWCDAYAFCQWAGKRLCGSRQPATALRGWEQAGDPMLSQWSYACTSAGTRRFPYGEVYDPGACNTAKRVESPSIVLDVGSMPACRTPAGVYDLSGNVEEWVDACAGSAGAMDRCGVQGLSAFEDPAAPVDFSCKGSGYGDVRSAPYELRGFRCCAP